MKAYAPYLLYQAARFGALTIPQMIQICEGKCKQSSLYRAVRVLVGDKTLQLVMNSATRCRAYCPTTDGREIALYTREPMASCVRAVELDHTIDSASVLLELCRYENVTGIATPFEMKLSEVRKFCHDRIPDGIVRVSQKDRHFEYAVEVERTKRNLDRVNEVLDRYWQSIRRGMECAGLLVVCMDPEIAARYRSAISEMPELFQTRVRVVEGLGLTGLNTSAFGQRTRALSMTLELSRNSSPEGNEYSPIKSESLLAGTPYKIGTPLGARHQTETEVTL